MAEETPNLGMKEYTLFLVSVLPVMAGATIAPALPEIAKAFPDSSALSIQIILTITGLFTGIGALFVGGFIDKYGRRGPLMISLIIFGFAGSAGLFLNTISSVLVSRAIFGIGVAGVMTISTTLIGDYYTGPMRNKVIGTQATIMTFSGVVFIYFGGLLAEINWHLPFAMYLLGLIVLLGVFFKLDEPDWKPTAEESAEISHHDQSLVEHRAVLAFAYSVGFIAIVLFYFVIIFLPFYLSENFGRSPSDVGTVLAVNSLVAGIGALNFKRIKPRVHYHVLFTVIFIAMAGGFFILSTASSYGMVFVSMFVFGLGVGFFGPNLNSWLFGRAHAPIRGRVIGGYTTAIFIGQFLSPVFGNLVLGFTDISGLYLISAIISLIVGVSFILYGYLNKTHTE
ncbi:MAG: MFS transporter [Candidatus Kariarchaeaceae archaeon]|jgi:MFS family permease